MEDRKKVMLGSAVAAGLLTSALVGGFAFAGPSVTTEPKATDEATAVVADDDAVEHEFEGEEVGNNGDGVADANEATEAEEAEEASSDEADGIDHQFEGEEVGENGNGIPDANEAAETK